MFCCQFAPVKRKSLNFETRTSYVHDSARRLQVLCGVCNSYSQHLYERLYDELGTDGITLTVEFCDSLVEACAGTSLGYDDAYCDVHTGGSDQYWSYPLSEEGAEVAAFSACHALKPALVSLSHGLRPRTNFLAVD